MRTLVLAASAILVLAGAGCSPASERNVAPGVQPAAANSALSKWEGQLVRRPGNTPEDGKVYLIQDGKKRWVISADWLKRHGYNFPADVKEISANELAAIPLGDVIP